MNMPKVTVIIPTYNGADFLGEAIRSVLEQTYPNFELLVVNDASPDHTTEVVKQFEDSRLKYIVHEENRGVGRARYTGIQASTGEIIAFLDQDDYFHPEKLQAHVAFLERHLDIGFSYNARFELNYSATTIRDLWRPPYNISLSDLVLWFPISPSDAVIRRKWALEIKWLGQRRGAEIAQFGGLYMAGCKFGYVDRALNYRRHHSGRIIKDLYKACENEISNQVQILMDPRFPPELLGIRNIAHSRLYGYWAYHAFVQGETALGQEFIRNMVRLKPSVIEGKPREMMLLFLINCIDDESMNHETLLEQILSQLPSEVSVVSEEYPWAVTEGYLLKGIRAMMWDQREDGIGHFEKAAKLGAYVDDYFLDTLSHKLLDYEMEFGADAAQGILRTLTPLLKKLSGGSNVRPLIGRYLLNGAHRYYSAGEYANAKKMLIRVICNEPKYLADRGVLSSFGRSTLKLLYKNIIRS